MIRAQKDIHAWDQWLGELQTELLFELLDHYKINRQASNRWFLLSYHLASDHVPAFTIAKGQGPGRPRKSMTIRDLLRWGRAGRPKKWTDKRYREMLESVKEMARRKGYSGRGAISRAIADLIRDEAKKRNEAPEAAVREDLPHFRKRYSEAARKFPEIALK